MLYPRKTHSPSVDTARAMLTERRDERQTAED